MGRDASLCVRKCRFSVFADAFIFCYLRSLVIFFTIYTFGKEDVYPLLKYNLSLFDAFFVMVCLYGSR